MRGVLALVFTHRLVCLSCTKQIGNRREFDQLALIRLNPMGATRCLTQGHLCFEVASLLLQLGKKGRGGDKGTTTVARSGGCRAVHGLWFEAIAIGEADGIKVGPYQG